MPEQMRPESDQKAPDPSNNYERAHPKREGGLTDTAGDATPTPSPDRHATRAIENDPSRQINGEDSNPQREQSTQSSTQSPAPQQPDHSMFEEEPTGWDLAPQDIKDPQMKRHPRTEGKGGTP